MRLPRLYHGLLAVPGGGLKIVVTNAGTPSTDDGTALIDLWMEA